MEGPALHLVVFLLLVQIGAVGVLAFARLGDVRNMPPALQDLAARLGNRSALRLELPPAWVQLCRAWDTWLPDLQRHAPRLLRTEGLLQPNGPLWRAMTDFAARADGLRPEALIPAAAGEKRLTVLAVSPPSAVVAELMTPGGAQRVNDAQMTILVLARSLEAWVQWDQLRSLHALLQRRGLVRAAAALQPKLPPARGTLGFKLDTGRTLKLLNEISLDPAALLLVSRWNEYSRLAADMRADANPELRALPDRFLEGLTDRSTLAEFAESLGEPLEELRRHSDRETAVPADPTRP